LNLSEGECLEFLRRLTMTNARSQWHYSNFLIVDDVSRPVAALSAVRAADAYPKATTAIVETLKSFDLTPAERTSFWKRGDYLFTCTTRPADDSLTVEVAAALPGCRKRGYIVALLAQAFDEGRGQGLKEAHTTCFIGNIPAERAYARAGFLFAGERRHPDFEAVAGVPGIRQFTREL
jgi:hypothetical protein